MQPATIADIYCGNAAEIDRRWSLNGRSGNTIKFNGILAPCPQTAEGQTARSLLTLMLTGSQIEIGRTYGVSAEGHLLCDVYHRGLHLTTQVPTRYIGKDTGSSCSQCGGYCAGLNKGPPIAVAENDSVWHGPCFTKDIADGGRDHGRLERRQVRLSIGALEGLATESSQLIERSVRKEGDVQDDRSGGTRNGTHRDHLGLWSSPDGPADHAWPRDDSSACRHRLVRSLQSVPKRPDGPHINWTNVSTGGACPSIVGTLPFLVKTSC